MVFLWCPLPVTWPTISRSLIFSQLSSWTIFRKWWVSKYSTLIFQRCVIQVLCVSIHSYIVILYFDVYFYIIYVIITGKPQRLLNISLVVNNATTNLSWIWFYTRTVSEYRKCFMTRYKLKTIWVGTLKHNCFYLCYFKWVLLLANTIAEVVTII